MNRLWLFCVLTLFACQRNGADRSQLIIVPEAQMNSLGQDAYAEIKTSESVVEEGETAALVRSIGERVAAVIDNDFDWEFNYFDSDTINAFCLPGGKVGVYRGIIKPASNSDRLAAIMGHEVAHAVARHGAERMSQQIVAQVGLTLASLTLSNEESRGPILAALGLGTNVGVLLPFSRLHESEADALGLEYMAKAGYDPRQAVALWDAMDKLSEGQRPPELISTHPDPRSRIKDIEKLLPKMMPLWEASDKQPQIQLRG